MKRILALMLTVILTFSLMNFTVLAQNSIGFTVKIEDDGNGNIIYNVDMKGVFDANDRVFVEVADTNGTPVVIEQLTSDSTGNFTITKTFSEEGEYDVFVNGYNSGSLTSSFTLQAQTYYEGIIDTFAAGTVDEIINLLDTQGSDLGLDMKYYNGASKTAIAEKISEVTGITVFNLAESFDKCVALTYLSTPALYNKADEILAYYDSYLNIKNSSNSMYADFVSFDSDLKNKILSDAFSNLGDTAGASTKFNFTVAKNVITELSATEIDGFILSHNTYYGFLGYEDLTTVQKSQLISDLKKADLGIKQSDLADAYNKIMSGEDEEEEETPTVNPNLNGNRNESISSGPSGGGGGGAKYDQESLVKPLDVTQNQISFDDLGSAEWAKDAILTLAKRGVINGKSEKSFVPNDNITRKEYSKILALAFELQGDGAKCDYTDVSASDWAYSYIASMHKHGLITGYPDGSFGGNGNITRQDIAVVLYRYMLKNKYITNVTSVSNTFKDSSNIADYAESSVLMLAQIGLLTGNSEGFFNPTASATRAEVCVIVNRALEYIKNNKQ